MGPRLPLTLLLSLLLLAGCVGDPAPEDVEAASAEEDEIGSSPLLQELGAQPAAQASATLPAAPSDNASAAPSEPWWVLRVDATPEGGLGGFHWQVPAGALVPWDLADEFESDEKVVALEIAPVVPGGKEAALLSWGLLALYDDDGGLVLGGGYGYLPFETDAPGVELPPAATPGYATLFEIDENASIPFVVFAQTSEPMEFAVAFRVLDADPETGDDAVESTAAFLEARKGSPLALAGTTGSGVSLTAYEHVCFGGFPVGPSECYQTTMGDPLIERVTSAAPGPWSGVIGAESAFEHGWASADAYVVELGGGVVRWKGDAAARDQAVASEGVQASAYPTIFAPTALIAVAGVSATGDADGPSSVRLEADFASYSGLLRIVSVSKLEFGATLEELVGAKAYTGTYSQGELPEPAVYLDEVGRPRMPTHEERVSAFFGARPLPPS